MRRNAKENVSFLARFPNAVKVEVLKVSYAAVDNLEMIGRSSLTEISPFDEHHRQTSQRSLPSGRSTKYPPTYNDEVVFFISQA